MDARLDAVLRDSWGMVHVLPVVSEHVHATELYYHAENVRKAAALPWMYVTEQSDFTASVPDELWAPLL